MLRKLDEKLTNPFTVRRLSRPLNPWEVIDSVFETTSPKHALQGISRCLWNISLGAVSGVSTLFAVPLTECRRGDKMSVLKSTGRGVGSCVLLTLCGVFTGVGQLANGVMNTPKAIMSMTGEDYWDKDVGAWVKVDLNTEFATLPADYADLLAEARENFRERADDSELSVTSADATAAADEAQEALEEEKTDYYGVLGLTKKATMNEIRSAFHCKSLKMHPDRNLDDVNATSKFQELIQAYNILSDEETRRAYDLTGKVAGSSNIQAHLYEQFQAVFSMNFLEFFVGFMKVSFFLIHDSTFNVDLRKRIQRRRVLLLAKRLCGIVDDEYQLRASNPIIVDAVTTRTGPAIMSIVAEQYAVAARQHLNENCIVREVDKLKTFSQKLLSSACGAWSFGVSVFDVMRGGANLDNFANMMLTFCESDVRSSVLHAAQLILYDTSVSREQRRLRAENLLKLSQMIKDECQKRINDFH